MQSLRRWVIGSLIAIATTLSLLSVQLHDLRAQAPVPATPSAPTLQTAGLTLTPIAKDIYGLLASTDFPPKTPNAAICNGGIIIGSTGVLVVDPFQNEALANLLFETVKTVTDQPIRYVVNTHYHFDHTGGNPGALKQNIPIIGRGPIREFMLEKNRQMDPNPTPPTMIVNGKSDLWLGDRQVQLREFEGHSGGTDLIVYVPDQDVLMGGDLLFHQRIPYVADGNLKRWQDSLAALISEYPTAKMMPGHGPMGDRTAIESLQGYFKTLETLALDWKAKGLSQQQAIKTPLPKEYANYLFKGMFPSNLETAYQQITLGKNDTASIQRYALAQSKQLQSL
jgi:glyoxylase-like metal-dependent hydrolase (beta-lactamase superfamily II)